MNAGDIVTNGGPPMTVELVEGDLAQCAWFEGVEQHRGKFPVATLKPTAAVLTAPSARVKVRWKVAHHGFAAGVGDVMDIPASVAQRHVAAGNVEILDRPLDGRVADQILSPAAAAQLDAIIAKARGQGASPGLREGLIGPGDGDTPKATPHETDESRPPETPGHVSV